jgi:hypothetical protein
LRQHPGIERIKGRSRKKGISSQEHFSVPKAEKMVIA